MCNCEYDYSVVTLIGFLLRLYVCSLCASKSSSLNKGCVCGCSSCIDQEKQLLEAAEGKRQLLAAALRGRVDEVASLLDQGVDIQCKNWVRNERID